MDWVLIVCLAVALLAMFVVFGPERERTVSEQPETPPAQVRKTGRASISAILIFGALLFVFGWLALDIADGFSFAGAQAILIFAAMSAFGATIIFGRGDRFFDWLLPYGFAALVVLGVLAIFFDPSPKGGIQSNDCEYLPNMYQPC